MGGEHILIKKGESDRRKMKSESEKRSMASLMPIWGGLVAPKRKCLKRIGFLTILLKGQAADRAENHNQNVRIWAVSRSKK